MASDSALPTNGPLYSRRAVLTRVVFFIAAFASLQAGYDAARDTWLERLVVDQATVRPAAWLINAAAPTVDVEAAGTRLRAPGGGINIMNGCEGTEVAFLMIAALLVAPAISLRQRVIGMVTGTAGVFLLNQARVIALFFAFRNDKALFDVLHGTVAPLLLVLGTAAFFTLWVNTHAPSASEAP